MTALRDERNTENEGDDDEEDGDEGPHGTHSDEEEDENDQMEESSDDGETTVGTPPSTSSSTTSVHGRRRSGRAVRMKSGGMDKEDESSPNPGPSDDEENSVPSGNAPSTANPDASYERNTAAAARVALLSAVEGGGEGGKRGRGKGRKSKGSAKDGDDEGDPNECGGGSGVGIRPLVSLFFYSDGPPGKEKHGSASVSDRGGKKKRGIKTAQGKLLGIIRDRTHFHKGHARRLFAGLADILVGVCEGEEYVPASAYEDDDDEGEGDPSDKRGNGHGGGAGGGVKDKTLSLTSSGSTAIIPDEASTEALLFMRASALLLESYLNGLLDRDKKRRKSSSRGSNSGLRKGTAMHSVGRGSTSLTVMEKEHPILEEALSVAEMLHGTLFSLQTCGEHGLRTQSSIASLCEQWWRCNFQYRELLVTQLIPLLLVKSLDGNARQVDVKRMFGLRDALNLLDFDDGSIDYLRSLLLKTVCSPMYLKSVEGRRFIVRLFHLHPTLVTDLHKSIRTQIPDAKRVILLSYGDIYLRSWKESPPTPTSATLTSSDEVDDEDGSFAAGEKDSEFNGSVSIRTSLEENVLQDLMYAALHVANAGTARAVRLVLSPLHREKKTPEIELLLYRMYGPILWRALKSANPLVRVNASSILAETFPLRDPNGGQIRTDESMKKAVTALLSLLDDTHPRVRVAGADAAAKILTFFWDALPAENIRSLLNRIITKHASDVSSAMVRASAVSAITLLLEEGPHSHAVLRSLLPSLGNLLHDRVERVRHSVVRMLLAIKRIRHIKFYHVVPVDHLLARLAAEGGCFAGGVGGLGNGHLKGPVASALTELLLNSYFPQGEGLTGAHQIRRTIQFLSSNPDAAAVFYANLSTHKNANSVAKLTAMLLRCLVVAVQRSQKDAETMAEPDESDAKMRGRGKGKRPRESKQGGEGGREGCSSSSEQLDGRGGGGDVSISQESVAGSSGEATVLTASNTSLMASIAETICCLWGSISDALKESENKASHDFLMAEFSGSTLTDVYSYFDEMVLASSALATCDGKECFDRADVRVTADNDENNNVNDGVEYHNRILSDCHRICSSLLRCAGRMSSDSLCNLPSILMNKIAKAGKQQGDGMRREGICEKSCLARGNLIPYIGLLCLWGRSEEVATSLSRSISSAFRDGNDDAEDKGINEGTPGQENSTTPKKAKKKAKRKSTKRRSSSRTRKRLSSTNGNINNNSSIPELPPDIALKVLGGILAGGDDGCVAAREAILASEMACSAIEGALEGATNAAEKILNTTEMRDLNFSETEISHILSACESYGRLALHKAAFAAESQNVPLANLTPQASILLNWITNTVAPALVRKTPSLGDLNLSKISAATDESPIPPFSPLATEPANRRTNRNSTPLRFSSFSSAGLPIDGDTAALDGLPSFIYGRAAAVSLIKSAMILFAEWLVVGGGESDGSAVMDIARGVSKWCEVLTIPCTDIKVRHELLPSFCRLTLTLVKISADCTTVLSKLLISCDQVELGSNDEVILKKLIISSLALRTPSEAYPSSHCVGNSTRERAIVAVLDAAFASAKDMLSTTLTTANTGDEVATQPPSRSNGLSLSTPQLEQNEEEEEGVLTSSTIFSRLPSGIKFALSVMMNNGPGRIIAAKHLSKQLSDKEKNFGKEGDFIFQAQLLQHICRNVIHPKVKKDKSHTEIISIVRRIDLSWIERDSELYKIVIQFATSPRKGRASTTPKTRRTR